MSRSVFDLFNINSLISAPHSCSIKSVSLSVLLLLQVNHFVFYCQNLCYTADVDWTTEGIVTNVSSVLYKAGVLKSIAQGPKIQITPKFTGRTEKLFIERTKF